MRFSVLATDYDNTLATNGAVSAEAWEALTRLRRSGRELVLVTGRELDDLLAICAHPELFSRIVAENGGLLYRPDTGELRTLAPRRRRALPRRCAHAASCIWAWARR